VAERYSVLHWNVHTRKKVFSPAALSRSEICHGLSRHRAACQSKSRRLVTVAWAASCRRVGDLRASTDALMSVARTYVTVE
jgi:hypothetical protein